MKRIIAAAALSVLAGLAAAQSTYPNRPIRMIVPWPPGQATDLVGRLVAQRMSEIFGFQVIADNRSGAGGQIGTDLAAKATPDGYTLLAASAGPVTISPLLQKTPYDPERELAPVATAGLSPYILVTHPGFPAANVREFLGLVRASPGKHTFATSGAGAAAHLVTEWFNSAAGIKAIHVPYKGSTPALTDLMAGNVAFAIETVAATLPHIRSGRLKPFGISLAKGSSLAPDIPALAATVPIPGFDVGAWIGVMVPAGTPAPLVDRLAGAMDRIMQQPDARERLAAIGLEVQYRRPDEFRAYLREQRSRFTEVIKQAGIRIE